MWVCALGIRRRRCVTVGRTPRWVGWVGTTNRRSWSTFGQGGFNAITRARRSHPAPARASVRGACAPASAAALGSPSGWVCPSGGVGAGYLRRCVPRAPVAKLLLVPSLTPLLLSSFLTPLLRCALALVSPPPVSTSRHARDPRYILHDWVLTWGNDDRVWP
jgi:hypothetical protein